MKHLDFWSGPIIECSIIADWLAKNFGSMQLMWMWKSTSRFEALRATAICKSGRKREGEMNLMLRFDDCIFFEWKSKPWYMLWCGSKWEDPALNYLGYPNEWKSLETTVLYLLSGTTEIVKTWHTSIPITRCTHSLAVETNTHIDSE